MIKIPRFNVDDWNQVHKWIKEWSEAPVPKDLPDFAPKNIEIYPIILALLTLTPLNWGTSSCDLTNGY